MEAASSELIASRVAPVPPVNVVIDGRKIGDGGIGVYIENLLSGLIEVGGVRLTVITRHGAESSLQNTAQIEWVFDDARAYSLDELLFMPKRLDLRAFDLFHAPHYTLPYRLAIPSVVTVHDLIHMTHPERFYYPLVARTLIGSAVRRAEAVIAVSRDTRRQLIERFDVRDDKVSFVPNAVAGFLSDTSPKLHHDRKEPFFLAVLSNIKPHKGLADLVAAYSQYRSSGAWKLVVPDAPQLVLAGFGSAAIAGDPSLQALVSSIEGIHVQGAVSNEDLAGLYRSAHALVVPSRAEGFCLPALEAQAVGTPVVVRPVPAVQELVTERDVVASDFSVAALVDALHGGLRRGVATHREVDRVHLARFARVAVAQSVRDIYRRVAATRVSA